MQNILVPTDFSNNAFHALDYATELLKNEECNFFLLHVFTEKKGFKSKGIKEDGENILTKMEEDSKVRLKRILLKIKKQKDNQKHTYRLLSERSGLIQVINSRIEELSIDLIVMGNKGKKSSIPVFFGNTATKALQTVKKCPVLTVPKNTGFSIPKEIAFVTDFKKTFDAKVINPLLEIAALYGAAIRIVHINDEEPLDKFRQSNLDTLLAYFKTVEHSFQRIPNFISKTKIIQVFLEQSGSDMLAMVNNEHGLLEKMLREPIIEKMIFNIDIPFLVIPETS